VTRVALSNAQKVQVWWDEHRGTRITYRIVCEVLGLPNLRRADLRDADLRDANLRDANRLTMQLRGMPFGELVLFPTPDGWHLYVGCWGGTPEALRELIAGDDGWPEARGEEIAKRRPYLEAALTLVDLHIANNSGVIEALAEKWVTP
jgi:uncharacterized protein YjbI with pentapeptide repeats